MFASRIHHIVVVFNRKFLRFHNQLERNPRFYSGSRASPEQVSNNHPRLTLLDHNDSVSSSSSPSAALRKASSIQNLTPIETPWENVTLNRCLFVAISILVVTSGFQKLHGKSTKSTTTVTK